MTFEYHVLSIMLAAFDPPAGQKPHDYIIFATALYIDPSTVSCLTN
jgi:hypothetical protein